MRNFIEDGKVDGHEGLTREIGALLQIMVFP